MISVEVEGDENSSSFSPVNLAAQNNDFGGVEGFYIHRINNYKLNFLHDYGHVLFRLIQETLNEHVGIYTIDSGQLIETY